MKNIHSDTFIGMVMLLVSAYFYSLTTAMPEGPAVFPKLILLILMALSLVIMSQGLIASYQAKLKGHAVERYFQKIRGPATIYVALCLYVALIEVLGFFAASTIASAFFMAFFGIRSYTRILMVLTGINVFIYLLFVWQLKIALPSGMLI